MNIDAQCYSYALEGQEYAKSYIFHRGNEEVCVDAITYCADRIIALRTLEAAGSQVAK